MSGENLIDEELSVATFLIHSHLGKRSDEGQHLSLGCTVPEHRLDGRLEGPLLEEQRFRGIRNLGCCLGGKNATTRRPGQSGTDVHHGIRQRQEIDLGRAVQDRDLVVVLQGATEKIVINPTDPYHPEISELSTAKGTDACRPVYRNPCIEREKDLLVPNRKSGFEIAVDEPDRTGFLVGGPFEVSPPSRRAPLQARHWRQGSRR